MYTLYKFHFLNGISEINQLFDDILIIWPAPVYIYNIIPFYKWTKNCKQNHTCAKVIHSTVLEFVWNQTETTSSAGHQYGWHIFPKDPQKGGNKVEFDSIEPNKTCVNTHDTLFCDEN